MKANESKSDSYSTPALLKWRSLTDVPLMVIAIASLPFLILELRRNDLAQSDQFVIELVNVLVLIAFLLDYVVELVLARNRAKFVRHEWTSLAIVLAQVLAIIPAFAGFGILRVARSARLFRVIVVAVRVAAVGGAAARQGREMLRKHAAELALGLAGMTWLCSAIAFLFLEDSAGQGGYTIGDALWWSASTITTVGYGDVIPKTGAGRGIGIFTMVVGISTFAIITAKVAEFLVRIGSKSSEPSGTADSGIPPPALWVADPRGRNELRWFNGSDWTNFVSNRGEISIDHLQPTTLRA